MSKVVRLGTRGSELALWQTRWVKERLKQNFPDVEFETVVIKTTGDKNLDSPLAQIGDKGLFTKELDISLLNGDIELAVHSMKDVPTEFHEDLTIAAVTERWNVSDVLISRSAKSIQDLPEGAVLATGSLRRKAQLLHYRPDLRIVDIRGNLNTRFRKFDEADWDGMILAAAGVERLGLGDRITQKIPTDVMLPAVGQGCFAVITRKENQEIIEMLVSIHQPEVAECVTAERALLRALEGGCQVPLGALATTDGFRLRLEGCVASLDGRKYFRDQVEFPVDEAQSAGEKLAGRLIKAGAGEVLEEIRKV
jgi:hydroxymethylbilane synthase